jgi:hypothetical protein
MKNLYTLFILVLSYCANSQCVTTMNFSVTAPTCTGCCTASATVSHSCAMTYTWFPGGCAGNTCSNMCPGTYTVYAAMASTACCGSSVGTATVLVPAAPSGMVEHEPLNDLIISQNHGNEITISGTSKPGYILDVKIIDLSGKIVYKCSIDSEKTVTISPKINAGLYTLLISDTADRNRTVKKIVVRE